MSNKQDFKFKLETKATDTQMKHREQLYRLFRERPMPDDQLMISLGLYMRSSALAKILFLNELYALIINLPGVIMEFGTWLGQNIVVFENLRAIYEPFNQSRRIIGFDTFQGYPSLSEKDKRGDVLREGGYPVPPNYMSYLEKLVDYHEKNNVLGNIKKHQVIKGNVTKTVPNFFKKNLGSVVALAYFDLALYEPTRVCLETIKPNLIRGSVIMLDEFNSHDYPGETIAFKETFKDMKYSVRSSKYINDRAIVIMD